MSEKNENLTSFESLQKNFKGLSLQRQETANGIVTTATESNKKPLITATDFDNHKIEFVFNPTLSRENIITILNTPYPPSVPKWKTTPGITDLYQQLFFSNLNQGISESARGTTPGFFYSGISSESIRNPFGGKAHDQLVSFSANAISLGKDEIKNNPQYQNIRDHIEAEIARDSEILGLYQLEFDSLLQKRGGKESEEKGKYILLVVKGKFTLPTKEGDIRVFHDNEDIKIVARKIEDRKISDDSEKLLSVITAFIAEANALKHPFRG